MLARRRRGPAEAAIEVKRQSQQQRIGFPRGLRRTRCLPNDQREVSAPPVTLSRPAATPTPPAAGASRTFFRTLNSAVR